MNLLYQMADMLTTYERSRYANDAAFRARLAHRARGRALLSLRRQSDAARRGRSGRPVQDEGRP